MKSGRSEDNKALKASKVFSVNTGSVGIKNSTKRTNRWNHKTEEYGQVLSDHTEGRHFPFKEAMRMYPELPHEDTSVIEKRAILEIYTDQALVSPAKIKLQLFPLNKETQMELEKDGHNPYLELTLRGQKKISSVLKHLKKKWGSSKIARWELMLFPYRTTENISNCRRWTINDNDTTAAAVYYAVGSPAIFRLRYGWFFIPFEAGVHSEGTQGGCNANAKTLDDECDKAEVASKKYKEIDVDAATNAVAAQKLDNASVYPMDNEPKASGSLGQPSLQWLDSLNNIGIGGLLSETSFQGSFGTLDPKSSGSNAGVQSSQIFSDSLDAFIAAQISHPLVSRVPAEELRTSILDGEETCHAFPLQKSITPADVQTVSGKDTVASTQDISSNPLKMPKIDKVFDQEESPASGKTQTDIMLSSRLYDDERSLGLTGIKWNDSLGPFDLGLPARSLIGGTGDSFSSGGFVR